MDGINLLNVLKAGPSTCQALVAAVSGRRFPGQELNCLKAGASFYYPKDAHDWDAVATQIKQRLSAGALDCRETLTVGRVVLEQKSFPFWNASCATAPAWSAGKNCNAKFGAGAQA